MNILIKIGYLQHTMVMHQRNLTENLIEDFKNEIKKLRWKSTPMNNLIRVVRPDDDDKSILKT